MAYIVEDDLKAYMPSSELTNLKETIQASPLVTNVSKLLENVCALADTKLQGLYVIPLAEEYVTLSLKSALCKIVIWELSGSMSSISEQVRLQREKNYNDGMKFLNECADGSTKLINTATALSEDDKYVFDSVVRIDRAFN